MLLLFLLSTNEINFWDLFIFHLVFNIDCLASSGVFDDLIIFITLSKFSTETERPIKIWALSSAFFKSNLTLAITVCSLKDKNSEINSFKFAMIFVLLTSLSSYFYFLIKNK